MFPTRYTGFSTDEDDIIEREFAYSSLSDSGGPAGGTGSMSTGSSSTRTPDRMLSMHAMAVSGMGGTGNEEVLLKRRMTKSKGKRRSLAEARVGGSNMVGIKSRFTESIGVDHGSRRRSSAKADFDHYMNTFFSDDDYDDDDGSGIARRSDVLAMYKEIMRHETAFTKVLATEDARQLMEPFLHIDIDEERELLGDEEAIKKLKLQASLMRAKTIQETDDELEALSADERFARIERDLQAVLQRFTNSSFIQDLESAILDFCVNSETTEELAGLPLIVIIPDGYLRMVAHGVAQYYSLFTRSVDFHGERVTLISKPRLYRAPHVRMPPLKCARLSEYINEHFAATVNNSTDQASSLSSQTATPGYEKGPEEYFTIVTSTETRLEMYRCLRVKTSARRKRYRRRREQQQRQHQQSRLKVHA